MGPYVEFSYGLILVCVCVGEYTDYEFCFIKLLAHTSHLFFTHFMPSFSHPDCSFSLFYTAEPADFAFFTVFNFVNFFFE